MTTITQQQINTELQKFKNSMEMLKDKGELMNFIKSLSNEDKRIFAKNNIMLHESFKKILKRKKVIKIIRSKKKEEVREHYVDSDFNKLMNEEDEYHQNRVKCIIEMSKHREEKGWEHKLWYIVEMKKENVRHENAREELEEEEEDAPEHNVCCGCGKYKDSGNTCECGCSHREKCEKCQEEDEEEECCGILGCECRYVEKLCYKCGKDMKDIKDFIRDKYGYKNCIVCI